jgi:hypothetical protein
VALLNRFKKRASSCDAEHALEQAGCSSGHLVHLLPNKNSAQLLRLQRRIFWA